MFHVVILNGKFNENQPEIKELLSSFSSYKEAQTEALKAQLKSKKLQIGVFKKDHYIGQHTNSPLFHVFQ